MAFALVGLSLKSLAVDTHAVLEAWLAAQTNLVTWQADFTQTRTLTTLTQPLISHGRVYFAAPNRFRWEIGEPPQTIALRQPEQVLVIYPRLKRAERYPLDSSKGGPWKDAMALLDAGFPRSQSELESRFRILSLIESENRWWLSLQPKAASARRLMPEIRLAFAREGHGLIATELKFMDGSTMRSEFTHIVFNAQQDLNLFTPVLGSEIQVSEPSKK